jgi:hypothetical protein
MLTGKRPVFGGMRQTGCSRPKTVRQRISEITIVRARVPTSRSTAVIWIQGALISPPQGGQFCVPIYNEPDLKVIKGIVDVILKYLLPQPG